MMAKFLDYCRDNWDGWAFVLRLMGVYMMVVLNIEN
jgi:hypothetical protein